MNRSLTLGGVDVIPSEHIPVGFAFQGDRSVIMHPLDVIAVTHHDDPHTRLDAAITYLTVRALDDLDAVERRLVRS